MDTYQSQQHTSFTGEDIHAMSSTRKKVIAGSLVALVLIGGGIAYYQYKKNHQPVIIDGMKNLQDLEGGSQPVTTSTEDQGRALMELEQSTSMPHSATPTPTKPSSSSAKTTTSSPSKPSKATPPPDTSAQLNTLDSLNTQ